MAAFARRCSQASASSAPSSPCYNSRICRASNWMLSFSSLPAAPPYPPSDGPGTAAPAPALRAPSSGPGQPHPGRAFEPLPLTRAPKSFVRARGEDLKDPYLPCSHREPQRQSAPSLSSGAPQPLFPASQKSSQRASERFDPHPLSNAEKGVLSARRRPPLENTGRSRG